MGGTTQCGRTSMIFLKEALKEEVDVEIANLILTKKWGKLRQLFLTTKIMKLTNELCLILRFLTLWQRCF